LAIIALAPILIAVQKRWAYNFPLIEHDRHFWMTMVMVFLGTVVAAQAAWRFVWRRDCSYSPILGYVAIIAAYNVLYPIANGALDRSIAEQRVYLIERRYCLVKSWRLATMWLRPVATSDSREVTLHVSRTFCANARDGQELYVHVKPGFLNTAWVSHYDVMRNVEKEVEPD
jgi:hypothetical protein